MPAPWLRRSPPRPGRAHQRRHDKQHRSWPGGSEEALANRRVGRNVSGVQQILGDLHEVMHCHGGTLKQRDDVRPRDLSLTCDVVRERPVGGEPGRAGGVQQRAPCGVSTPSL
jgi:hypothetical protein